MIRDQEGRLKIRINLDPKVHYLTTSIIILVYEVIEKETMKILED